MTKAFKNNTKPGVPKMSGFSPKAPGVVAPMPAKQAAPVTPHKLMGDLNKSKFAK